MARSGLKKVTKSVRGKHGTVRRAYYVKAASPQVHGASRGRKIAGVLIGGAIGAGVGAVFGAAGGAGVGAYSTHRAIRNSMASQMSGTSGHVNGGDWGPGHRVDNWHRASAASHDEVRSATQHYIKHNAASVAGTAARTTATGAAVFGAGGAATGGAFGAALGYAIANRSGRGGSSGRALASANPPRGEWSPRMTGEYRPTHIKPHERPDSLHNSPREYDRRHADNQRRSSS